jgi:lipoprotein-releasing system ATP-binding protein
MLVVENVTKSYTTPRGVLPILNGISLSLNRGDAVAVMGPSGSGKSTLLYLLGALEPPSSGRITLDGEDPYALGERQQAAFRNRHIGFVFQDHSLLPQCSVLENVLTPLLAAPGLKARPTYVGRGFSPADAAAGKIDSSSDVDRAQALLEQVGLGDRLDHRPGELSGGEKQRAAVARALIGNPTLVLCDEPTGNLDRTSAEAVASLLLDLHAARNTILVVVTHSSPLAERFPIRYEMADGRLR